VGTSAATTVFTICSLELDVQLIDTALKKYVPHTFNKGYHFSAWNKSVYLFGLSDEKAVLRRDHQRGWSAIIYLTEQCFNRSIEIRFNNELHCISFVRSCPWGQNGKG